MERDSTVGSAAGVDSERSFWIHTYGCQMNVRDSEAVAALLVAAGWHWAPSEAEAAVVIVNSCTVRQKAEDKALGKVGNLLAAKRGGWPRRVGMMGCAVQRLGAKILEELPQLDFAVGPRAFGLLPRLFAAGRFPALELGDDLLPAALAAHEPGAWRAFVTVLVGCDNRCSYCIVPDVRGHEYSRPAREIIAEVRALAEHGVKEIFLLGQSVLRYGVANPAWGADDAPSPGGYTEPFPRLLEALAALPGVERLRFTSAHPAGCTDELVRAYREFPQLCRHLHLPVQSGSNRILREMGRRYTREEYLAAVARLRAFDPEFALTTDVIVGYPGETAADFEATRSLLEEAGIDNAFVFKFSPRPHTRAAALADDVSVAEKERRDQVLLADQEVRGLKRNQALVGTLREVMVEGVSKRNAGRLSGRDGGNRIVVWPRGEGAMPPPGSCRKLRITEAHAQILVGEEP